MTSIHTLTARLSGGAGPDFLAAVLRLRPAEAQLLRVLHDAGEAGMSPAELRLKAPVVWDFSRVAKNLNAKLEAAGLGGLRVANTCQRLGAGKAISIWRLLDEPASHDNQAA